MADPDDDPRRRGPYAKGVQRRQEILDRAIEVFADRGLDGTSLRAIGEAIGVSHAALRHYFSSREALLVEVLRERDVTASAKLTSIDGVFERMSAAADINAGIPGIIALHTMLMAASVEVGDEEARAFFTERFATARADLAAQLRDELASRGTMSDAELEQIAGIILATFDGLQVQWLLDPTVDIAGSLRMLQRLVR
jgi:TetR/AcrR family transcriptional regulator, transcriptional repressor of aconitase